MRTYTLQPCPWCKSAATMNQDCDTGWYVSAGYKFAHMAAMAWNCCGQPDALPTLMPEPSRNTAQAPTHCE